MQREVPNINSTKDNLLHQTPYKYHLGFNRSK